MKSERTYPVYKVNKHAEGLLVGGHPWVYENDIQSSPEAEPENGTLVDVVSTKGAYLGTGFLSLKSKIRVRLISRNANDTFDAAFWKRRVEYAWAYRKTVLEPADLTACRVIFGEADQFPGLTVDRFNNILVTQTLSVGMEKLKPILFPLLAEVLCADGQTIEGIYERNDEALRAKEGLAQNKGWFDLPGETHPDSTQTEICENGVFYHVDFENGQKTGFFLDQKYNRRAVARIAAGHTVLDCFTHTGSFALNAAKGGAARVTAADISAEAIAMAQRNAQRAREDRGHRIAQVAGGNDEIQRFAGGALVAQRGMRVITHLRQQAAQADAVGRTHRHLRLQRLVVERALDQSLAIIE